MADIQTPDPPKAKKGLGKELGASGTFISSGIISLEEYNNKLSGLEGRKTFDIMRRSDGTVHASLQVCKLPILSIDYDIEPASDDVKDEYIANFVKRELFDRNINWYSFIREALSMFDFGFSVFEKTYELTDFEGQARIGLRSLGSRKQRTVQYWQTADGQPGIQQQLLGGVASNPSGVVSIPMEKLIVFTNNKEGENYEGISLLRFAFKDFDMKDKLGLVNAIALEKMGIGVPVLTTPADASEDEKRKARESLRQFRANEEAFLELPGATDGWKMEMLDMKANTVKDVLPTIQYHDRQIKLSVLAQFLDLGAHGSSGSRAVSQDHSQLFMMSEEAAVKVLVSTVQEALIKQMVDMNFIDLPNGYPKLTSGRIADEGILNLASAVNQLMTAGALTADPGFEGWIRENLHAPELPEELADPEKYQEAHKPQPKLLPSPDDPTLKPGEKPKPTDPKTDPSLDKKTKATIQAAQQIRKRLVDTLVN